jgi:hypothetical protein
MRLFLPLPSSFFFGSVSVPGAAKKLSPTQSLNDARAHTSLAPRE